MIVTSDNSVAVTGCESDYLQLLRNGAAGRSSLVLQQYHGRFLQKDELLSAHIRDWRDDIQANVAEIVADALKEQSCVCGDHETERLVEIAEELLQFHPELATAQVALLELYAKLGRAAEVERLHKKFTEDVPENVLPPLESFLGKRASPRLVGTTSFAGREVEMDALQECWQQAKAGSGNVAVILGEPGIGKTRLADYFLRKIAISGGATWIARCCAATQRLPYTVVSELIRENVSEAALAHSMEMLKSSDDRLQLEPSSDEHRHKLVESLTELVLEKSRGQPLVLFVDDAQWADDFTALLLSYWAYRLRGERFLMLLTVRTEEAEAPPDWIFSDLGRFSKLTLGRISIEAASEMVKTFEQHHGITLGKELRDAVLWQSGGRPFLILEALSSIVHDPSCKPTAEAVLTESAESVLCRRFRNLTSDASCVLAALATWGQEVAGDALSRLAAVFDRDFVEALDLLERRGIAYWHNGVVAFPHELMREAAYRSLMPATRALYHRRAADELSRTAGPNGLIAQHFASAGESPLAAMHALKAADEAMNDHLHTDYEYYCTLCIEHGSYQQQREAANILSRYLVRVGRTRELERIKHLLHGGGSDQAVLIAISELEHELSTGHCQVEDLLGKAKEIIRMADDLHDLTAAPVVATLIDIAFDAGASEFGSQVIDALLPQPGSCPANEAQIAVKSIVSVWRGVTDDFNIGLQQAEDALSSLSTVSSPTTAALCLASHGTLLLLAGRIREARERFQSAMELAIAAGDVRRQLSIHNNNGVVLLESGDFEGARLSFERVLTTPNVHARIRGYGNLAILYFEIEEFDKAVRAAEAVLSMKIVYRSQALEMLGHSILGLVNLSNSTSKARQHADNVKHVLEQCGWTAGDSTYPTLLMARLRLMDGFTNESVDLIDDMIVQVESRDVPCALKLKCEKARTLAKDYPDLAFAILRDVIGVSSETGATFIEHRARDIRSRLILL